MRPYCSRKGSMHILLCMYAANGARLSVGSACNEGRNWQKTVSISPNYSDADDPPFNDCVYSPQPTASSETQLVIPHIRNRRTDRAFGYAEAERCWRSGIFLFEAVEFCSKGDEVDDCFNDYKPGQSTCQCSRAGSLGEDSHHIDTVV